MKKGIISGIQKSGHRFAVSLAILSAAFFFSCEDDPMVDPKEAPKTGGSYGGRLSLPDSAVQKTGTADLPVSRPNPELF